VEKKREGGGVERESRKEEKEVILPGRESLKRFLRFRGSCWE